MKLIIDIPDVEYNRIKEWEDNITGYQTSLALYRAVRDGTPYEERPQGEWIDPQDCFCYQCSNCGEYTNNEGTVKEGLFDFCPKCGAKMKGGAE